MQVLLIFYLENKRKGLDLEEGERCGVWYACIFFSPMALSQVATHLIFRANCSHSYFPIPQVVLENN